MISETASLVTDCVLDQEVLPRESPPIVTDGGGSHVDGDDGVKESSVTNPANKISIHLPQPKEWINIKVISGNDHGKFSVFLDPICHYSPIFASLYQSLSTEAKSKPVELDTRSSNRFFGVFIHWLYTQTLPPPHMMTTGTPGLISIWILGGELQIPRLQNAAVCALANQRQWSLKARGVQSVLNLVGRDTSLFQLLVQMRAFSAFAEDKAENIDCYPKEFIADVAVSIHRRFMAGNLSREIDVDEFLVDDW